MSELVCTRRNEPATSGDTECRVEADAPKVVWASDFQFDSTVDGKAAKIASMIDEHTRESLLHLVERSITAERLVTGLEKVFLALGGPPEVLRVDNRSGDDFYC
ncbi:DDE-type integrase/transposase/recombinase [Nocardia sp. NPDC004278]